MRRLRARDAESYRLAKQQLEAPMLVLSVVFAAALLAPLLVEVGAAGQATLEAVQWFIWAAFVAEYLLLLWLAPNRWHMVRTHVLDLLIILLPFLRPLRLLRLLTVFSRAGVASRRLTGRPGFRGFLLVAVGVVAAGAAGVYAFERGVPGANIDTLGDALWWAVVTATTVGYGDHTPVTTQGRAVALVLMLIGVGVFGVVTANLAAFFVQSDEEADTAAHPDDVGGDLAAQVRALTAQVAALEQRLVAVGADAGTGAPAERDAGHDPGTDAPSARDVGPDQAPSSRDTGERPDR